MCFQFQSLGANAFHKHQTVAGEEIYCRRYQFVHLSGLNRPDKNGATRHTVCVILGNKLTEAGVEETG